MPKITSFLFRGVGAQIKNFNAQVQIVQSKFLIVKTQAQIAQAKNKIVKAKAQTLKKKLIKRKLSNIFKSTTTKKVYCFENQCIVTVGQGTVPLTDAYMSTILGDSNLLIY